MQAKTHTSSTRCGGLLETCTRLRYFCTSKASKLILLLRYEVYLLYQHKNIISLSSKQVRAVLRRKEAAADVVTYADVC